MSGRVLPEPLRVQVTRDGVPAAGVAVDWSTAYGSIVANGPTDADGLATATWTLGIGSPGIRRARARLSGNGGAEVEFTSLSSDPEFVAILNAQSETVVGGQLPVRARLSWRGTPIIGEAIEWIGGGIAPTALVTDANGEVAATWEVGVIAGARTALARIRSHVGRGPAAQFWADVRPGPPATFQWTDPSLGTPGLSYNKLWQRWRTTPLSVSARVTDTHGNGISGIPVSWSLATTGGAIFGTATAATGVDGYATTAIPIGAGVVGEDFVVTGSAPGLTAITSPRYLVDFLYVDFNGFGPYWSEPITTTVKAGTMVRVASPPPYPFSIPFTLFVLRGTGQWQELGAVGAPSSQPGGILEVRFDDPGTYQLRAEAFPGFTDILTVMVTP